MKGWWRRGGAREVEETKWEEKKKFRPHTHQACDQILVRVLHRSLVEEPIALAVFDVKDNLPKGIRKGLISTRAPDKVSNGGAPFFDSI